MADTVRERILKELECRCKEMKAPDTVWSIIQREALDEERVGMYSNMLSIMDTDETYEYGTGFIEPELRVEFEFWYRPKQGDTPSTELGIMLGSLKRLVLANTDLIETGTGTPLTLNMVLADSALSVEGIKDNIVTGFLMVDILYRHKNTDPSLLR